MHKQAS